MQHHKAKSGPLSQVRQSSLEEGGAKDESLDSLESPRRVEITELEKSSEQEQDREEVVSDVVVSGTGQL
jgi:hypothetical protein